MRILAFICLLVASLPSIAQQKPPSAEQKLLSVFQGRWTIDGSESTYLEVCDWIMGNHIQCISVSNEKNAIDSSVSYLSYLASEKTYVYYGIYGTGSSRTLRGNWVNDRFIFEGQRVTTEQKRKWKVTIIPVGNELHFIEEVSVNDGPWEKRADFMYRRAK